MLKARQQIDTVLKYLYDKKDNKTPVLLDDILKDEKLLEISGSKEELGRIINKLIVDKYCHRYPDYPLLQDDKKDMSKGLLSYCPITFDGRLFWEDGGYTKQQESNEADERIKNSREKRLSDGTVFLAVATFLLVLTEVLIHWNELRHVFSRH